MHNHIVAFAWVHKEFQRLIQNRLESIAQNLPIDIRERLLSEWNKK